MNDRAERDSTVGDPSDHDRVDDIDIESRAGGDAGRDPLDGDGRIVDWERTGRRIRATAAAVAVAVVLLWLLAGLVGDGIRLGDLGGWIGLGLGVMVVTEVVVVGGAAVRAERRAAVRGERLGSHDVGLLPPRLRRPDPVRPHESTLAEDGVDPAG